MMELGSDGGGAETGKGEANGAFGDFRREVIIDGYETV